VFSFVGQRFFFLDQEGKLHPSSHAPPRHDHGLVMHPSEQHLEMFLDRFFWVQKVDNYLIFFEERNRSILQLLNNLFLLYFFYLGRDGVD
jgi:hypothetical protein